MQEPKDGPTTGEKIVSFLETTQVVSGEILPVERETLIKELQAVPIDLAKDYVWAIGSQLENMLTLRDIIASSDNPNLAKHFVEGLNENLMSRLREIVSNMHYSACDNEIDKIVSATWGVSVPTPESKKKAEDLIAIIKAISEPRKVSQEAANTARIVALFGTLLVASTMGKDVEEAMLNRLSLMPESDLEWLIEIAATKLVAQVK